MENLSRTREKRCAQSRAAKLIGRSLLPRTGVCFELDLVLLFWGCGAHGRVLATSFDQPALLVVMLRVCLVRLLGVRICSARADLARRCQACHGCPGASAHLLILQLTVLFGRPATVQVCRRDTRE